MESTVNAHKQTNTTIIRKHTFSWLLGTYILSCIVMILALIKTGNFTLTHPSTMFSWGSSMWISKTDYHSLSASHYWSLKTRVTNDNPQQRKFATSFISITLCHATSQSRTTKVGAQPWQLKSVTIDQAIAMCRAHRPQPSKPWPHHPYQWKIKAIITKQRRGCMAYFKDLSNLEQSMLGFLRQKFQTIYIQNLKFLYVKFFSTLCFAIIILVFHSQRWEIILKCNLLMMTTLMKQKQEKGHDISLSFFSQPSDVLLYSGPHAQGLARMFFPLPKELYDIHCHLKMISTPTLKANFCQRYAQKIYLKELGYSSPYRPH